MVKLAYKFGDSHVTIFWVENKSLMIDVNPPYYVKKYKKKLTLQAGKGKENAAVMNDTTIT